MTKRFMVGSALVGGAILLALTLGLVRPDDAAPASVRAQVEAARSAVAKDMEGVAFRFVSARCRSDGGVVLTFEERTFPWSANTLAYASTETWPPVTWEAHVRLSTDEFNHEIGKFMGADRGRECPAK